MVLFQIVSKEEIARFRVVSVGVYRSAPDHPIGNKRPMLIQKMKSMVMQDIYCEQIIPGKLKVDIIFETDHVMAFHHTNPYWEHHVVIIPKTHIDSLSTYPNNSELNKDFFEAIRVVSKLFEDTYGGCRISSNVGNYQSSKHLHWYVHSGERLRDESGIPTRK